MTTVDLHLHSTASDGWLTPAQLVDAAAAAGLSAMALTDHDTVAAVPEVAALCDRAGIALVPGIEITAVENARDVHVLGYFVQVHPAGRSGDTTGFDAFLAAQREVRLHRIEEIVRRLSTLGMPLDRAALLGSVAPGRSVGRPVVARALMAHGYVGSISEAFERWLGTGCPAFVPRSGAPVPRVIDMIHRAGGLASLAHPGRTRVDDRLEEFRDAGLDALEVFHSDHDPAAVARYRQRASELGLLMTGGSDFHGDPERGITPGSTTLPPGEWARLNDARQRHARA
jgi:predicted metal-dependent phosphoesterase TrpH